MTRDDAPEPGRAWQAIPGFCGRVSLCGRPGWLGGDTAAPAGRGPGWLGGANSITSAIICTICVLFFFFYFGGCVTGGRRTGLYSAAADSIPILCITGQAPVAKLHKEDFQAVNISAIAAPLTKMAMTVLERPRCRAPSARPST